MTPRFPILLIVLILLIGCSSKTSQLSQPPPVQAAARQPTLYTAKDCFSSMVNLAQRWDPGAMPFHMESEVNAEATGQDGKATIWRGFFASRTRGTMKTIVCSGSYLPSSPARGFTDTPESPFPSNIPALMFDPTYLQIDSDKAFALTLGHGGSELIKKDQKQPVIYSLDWEPKSKELQWLVIFGTSRTDRQGLAVVDAKLGTFIGAGK
jgi:hypothetical protein